MCRRVEGVGGERKNETITLVEEGVNEGAQSAHISFTPQSGRHWYYRLPCYIKVDPEQLLTIKGALKYKVEGRVDPLASIRLGLTYNAYTDDTYKHIKARSSVHSIGGVYTPGEWEQCNGEPFNLVKILADKGKDSPYLVITNMMVMVLDMPLRQRLDIWVDDITLAHATDADVDAYRQSIKVDYNPPVYKLQNERYYYGYTGGLYTGYNKWDIYRHFMPKEHRALVNIEFMLNGFFTQVIAYNHKLDHLGENVDDIVRDTELLNDYGVSSVLVAYLTPYYHGERTFEECEATIRNTLPVLKEAKGLSGYLVLDEPKPERKVLEHWVWVKKLFHELDPDRPCSGPMNTHDRIRYYAQTELSLWIDEYSIRGMTFDDYDYGAGSVLSIETANRLAIEHGAKAVWNMNQAFGRLNAGMGPRMSTPAEHRLGNFISLANGGRALQYFTMNGYMPQPYKKRTHIEMTKRLVGFGTAVGAPAFPVGREAFRQGSIPPTYGPVLMGTYWDPECVLPLTCKDIDYRIPSPNKKALGAGFNRGSRYDVVVVYNRDTLNAQSGSIDLGKVLKGRAVHDLFTHEMMEPREGVIDLGPLEPGDGRMFVLATGPVYAEVKDQVVGAQYGLHKRLFDFYYREQRHNGLDMSAFAEVFAPGADSPGHTPATPSFALEELRTAYAKLKDREQGESPFNELYDLLKQGQADHVAIAEMQTKYLSKDTAGKINALINKEGYYDWYNQAFKLADGAILLRNLLYFGHTEEALPLARKWAPLMSAMKEANSKGEYAPFPGEEVDALHKAALALNDFDLLTALEENASDL